MQESARQLMGKITQNIINPIIVLLFVAATVYFVYGVVVFIAKAGDENEREKGKKHIQWGLVGMLIMVSVYGILGIITGTIGANPVSPHGGAPRMIG